MRCDESYDEGVTVYDVSGVKDSFFLTPKQYKMHNVKFKIINFSDFSDVCNQLSSANQSMNFHSSNF